jgi:hypothetical protein
MKYIQCVVCGFHVMAEDERCQNCGVLRPIESLAVREEDYSTFVTLAVVASVLIPLFGFGFAFGLNGAFCLALPVCVISVLVARATAKALVNNWSNRAQEAAVRQIARRTAPHQDSLVFKEDVIRKRIAELSLREQQVNDVLDRVRQNTGEQWQKVCATLEASIQTLQRQHARYRAKSVEIDTVRLQNKLAPFIYDSDKFSFLEINKYLETIEETQKSAVKLNGQLAEQRQILGSVPDIEELSQRVSEVQASMRQLHDALVGRQAVLALKGITPLDEALTPISAPVVAIRQSEVFNIQVAITDFSASFDELESEYMRVQTEEGLAQQVSEIINRMDAKP